MNFVECITQHVKDGELTERQAREVLEVYNREKTRNVKTKDPIIAEALAASTAASKFRADVDVATYQKFLTLRKIVSIGNRMAEEAEKYDMAKLDSFLNQFDRDGYDRGVQDNWFNRRKVVHHQAMAIWGKVLRDFEPNIAQRTKNMVAGGENLHGKATEAEIYQALKTGDSGNANANEIAKGFMTAWQWLRQRARDAGALMRDREDWDFFHTHDRMKLVTATENTWVGKVKGWIDTIKVFSEFEDTPFVMAARAAGKNNDEITDDLLRGIYKAIVGDPGEYVRDLEFQVQGKLANKWDKARQLHFKDGEAWLAYNKEFGEGDILQTMLKNVDELSHDIATIEQFSPNADLVVKYFTDVVKDDAKARSNTLERDLNSQSFLSEPFEVLSNRFRRTRHKNQPASAERDIQRSWDIVNRSALTPVNSKMARGFSTVRHVITSAVLGSAAVTAIPGDLATIYAASKFHNMPMMPTINNYLKLVVAGKNREELKDTIHEIGLMAEAFSANLITSQRYINDLPVNNLAKRLSDEVLRGTLLNRHTEAAREAFSMTFATEIGRYIGKDFDKLPGKTDFHDTNMKQLLGLYGITARDWEIISRAEHQKIGTSTAVDVTDVATLHKRHSDITREEAVDASTKLHHLMMQESAMGVLSTSLNTERMALQGLRRGTLPGEVMASVAMFKRFPLELYNTLFKRMFSDINEGAASKVKWAAQLVTALYIGGYISEQLANFASGNGFVPLLDEQGKPNLEIFGKSLLRSGALTIFGELTINTIGDAAEGNQDLLSTLAGPVIGGAAKDTALTTAKTYQFLSSLMHEDERGDTEKHWKALQIQAVRNLGRYVPGQSVWYWKALVRRNITEQLELMIDPDRARNFRKKDEELRKQGRIGYQQPGKPINPF